MIQKLTFFLSTIFIVFLFASCEKELSYENGGDLPGGGGTSSGTAIFSPAGASGGVCTGAVLDGVYTASKSVADTNSVDITVNVDSIGTYSISTNTVNGISFSGSGTFITTGLQTITLQASGTPAAAGNFNYTAGTNGCLFTVTVISGGSSGTSSYTFSGAPGNCATPVINGTYIAGTALSASNTVLLGVNVTATGTYSISTGSLNGVSFSGTGTFTTTGAQTIALTGSGTPTAAGDFSYQPGPTGCSFNITVSSTSGGGGGSGDFLRCKINGVLTNFNRNLIGYNLAPPSAGIPYSLSVQGKNSDAPTGQEELWVTVQNPTVVTTGVYNNGTFSSALNDRLCQVGFYPTGFPNLYWGSSVLTSNTFTVNLATITASSATGTFSGTLYESNGIGPQTKQITEGAFQISY